MKKLFSLVLSIAIISTLVACGSKPAATTATNATNESALMQNSHLMNTMMEITLLVLISTSSTLSAR